MRLHLSSVQGDQRLHERKSDTEAPLRPIQRLLRLCKQVEYAGKHFRCDSHAVVPNAQHRLVEPILQLYPDLPFAIGIFARIGEKIHDDLLEPYRVTLRPQRPVGERDRQRLRFLVGLRPGGLHCAMDDLPQVHELELQSDAGTYRDVAERVERLARVETGG